MLVLFFFTQIFTSLQAGNGLLSFVIYLFIFPDDVAKFQVRGALLLKPGREPGVSLSQNPLSDEDRTKLKVNHVNHWFSDVFYTFPRWPSDGEISPVSNKYLVGVFFCLFVFWVPGGDKYLSVLAVHTAVTYSHAHSCILLASDIFYLSLNHIWIEAIWGSAFFLKSCKSNKQSSYK